jgi:hypothetical protein
MTTTTYTIVKKFTTVALAGAQSAVAALVTCDWLQIVERKTSESRFVALYTCEDGEIDTYPVYILRRGESFVAIPSQYLDEDSAFTATNGDEVKLVDGSTDYIGIVA